MYLESKTFTFRKLVECCQLWKGKSFKVCEGIEVVCRIAGAERNLEKIILIVCKYFILKIFCLKHFDLWDFSTSKTYFLYPIDISYLLFD